MSAMGVLFDYFAAGSDEEAASVIDRLGGPGRVPQPSAPVTEQRRGLFRRKSESSPSTEGEARVFDTVSGGVDPVVQMGTFEELLTGRAYDDVVEDPRSGHAVAERDGGERLVLTLTDNLVEALRQASPDRLTELAVPWSQTEEFWGQGDPQSLAAFLTSLGRLAQRASEKGQRLYCWVCV